MHQELHATTDSPEAHTLRLQVADETDWIDPQLRSHSAEAAAFAEKYTRPATYRHPWHLERTAPELVPELDALLDELRRENEGLPDEPPDPRELLEAVGYYAATGAGDDLAERFRLWFGRYARRRADPARMNPRDGSDPLSLALMVWDELARLWFELAGDHPGNLWLLSPGFSYARWVTAKQLVEPHLSELRRRPLERSVVPDDVLTLAHKVLGAMNYARAPLEQLVAVLAVGTERPDDVGREAAGRRLAELAADIHAMRPYLIRGYRPGATAVELAPGLWAGWAYTVRPGVTGGVVTGGTEAEILAAANPIRCPILVNRQGRLCPDRQSWRTVDEFAPAGVDPLGMNLAVLSRLHGRLLELFAAADLDRFRWRPAQPPDGNAVDVGAEAPAGETLDRAIEVACLELAQEEPEPTPEESVPASAAQRVRVPALRFSKLIAGLRAQFGCEVRAGKGSEVAVFRPGGRIYSFGHHKRDFEVHPPLVRRILRRLGIDPAAWLDAVYRKGRAVGVSGARQTTGAVR